MEEVIEGGPWLFQGQPIVLQCWEQGMSLRKQKHKQIPIWIRLKHLPMEYWTEDGLSVVASGVGTPLYTDKITKECSRLDYARVCVLLDYNSTLPKHVIVISPFMQNGKEVPTRVEVEYEWLPQRCKTCCSLGHTMNSCPDQKKQSLRAPISVFVQKKQAMVNSDVSGSTDVASQTERLEAESLGGLNQNENGKSAKSINNSTLDSRTGHNPTAAEKGKAIVVANTFGVLGEDDTCTDEETHHGIEIYQTGPKSCSPRNGVT
ncbi:UNVERIFIED_CONTAM: hypothetical protein Sradi_7200600 [Sesamum radiatum]